MSLELDSLPQIFSQPNLEETTPQKFDIAISENRLLDLFPGAKFACSIRLLRTAYTGPAIRVRRTSDSTEQDFGFLANGDLDSFAIESFVNALGASDGLVTIMYDQSGNGIDLDNQLVEARLPKIVDAGILQTSMGLPSIFFDGIDDNLLSTDSLSSPVSNLFIFMVDQKTRLTVRNNNFNLNVLGNPSSDNRVAAFAPFNDGRIIWDAGNNDDDRVTTGFGFNDTVQHIWTFIKTAGTDNLKFNRDGVQLAQKTQVTTPTELSTIVLGAFDNTNDSFPMQMQFQELIFYDTDELSNVVSIESNLMNYWMPTFINWVNGANNLVNGVNNLVFRSDD